MTYQGSVFFLLSRLSSHPFFPFNRQQCASRFQGPAVTQQSTKWPKLPFFLWSVLEQWKPNSRAMFWRGRHCGSSGKPEQLRPLCCDDLLPRGATRCQCGVAGELSALQWWEWEEWEHWNILQVYAKPGRCGGRSCARISLPLPLCVCLSYCQSCKFLSLAAVMLLVHRCAFFISYLCGSPCVLSCTIRIRKCGVFFLCVCGSHQTFEAHKPLLYPACFTDVMTGVYSLLIPCCMQCIQHHCL